MCSAVQNQTHRSGARGEGPKCLGQALNWVVLKDIGDGTVPRESRLCGSLYGGTQPWRTSR